MIGLSEPGRVNIPAAREDQLIVVGRIGRIKAGIKGYRKTGQGSFIILCVLGNTRN